MKFYLSGFMMAFILTSSASAQHINIGVKGGLNVYKITDGSQYNSKAGLNKGPLIRASSNSESRNRGLQLGVFYLFKHKN